MVPLILLAAASVVNAQFDPNGPTQPGLPTGCVGSFPNTTICSQLNWHIPTADPCAPLDGIPRPGQQVYIKDQQNFCLALPDPNSIFLQNNYYLNNKLPTIVQAEGFIHSFCVGDYKPPGASAMPKYGIRSAHVVKNYTVAGSRYLQIHGKMDCGLLNVNCTQSFPGAYDDGGQYDDGPFVSCGKEPYSGTDASVHPGFPHYVEQAGDGLFCMRICEAGSEVVGGPCDLTHDTDGCEKFMKVSFTEGFTYTDVSTGVTTTMDVFIPPLPSATSTTTATGVVTTKNSNRMRSLRQEAQLNQAYLPAVSEAFPTSQPVLPQTGT
ncbi:UNVERIFIED_CONTAM: hypothetical protein HDU68_009064 [Siphonaria sp. JEL0065]|nr:hypothetical protein HDU68_009064 [Siphonaria sp. JEL0065]